MDHSADEQSIDEKQNNLGAVCGDVSTEYGTKQSEKVVNSASNLQPVLEGVVVKRREPSGHSGGLLKVNRLSQRSSILCMCQCEGSHAGKTNSDQKPEYCTMESHCLLHAVVGIGMKDNTGDGSIGCGEHETIAQEMGEKLAKHINKEKQFSVSTLLKSSHNSKSDELRTHDSNMTGNDGVLSRDDQSEKGNSIITIQDNHSPDNHSVMMDDDGDIADVGMKVSDLISRFNGVTNKGTTVDDGSDDDVDMASDRIDPVLGVTNDVKDIDDTNKAIDMIDHVTDVAHGGTVVDNAIDDVNKASSITMDHAADIANEYITADIDIGVVDKINDIIDHVVVGVFNDDTIRSLNSDEDCAPDVYGSECMAEISASCSLTSINAACEEVEQTMTEHTHLGGPEYDVDNVYTDGCVEGYDDRCREKEASPNGFDDTLKCESEDFDDSGSESDDSEVELERCEISVDDPDLGEVTEDGDSDSSDGGDDGVDDDVDKDNDEVEVEEEETSCMTDYSLGLLSAITVSEIVPVRLKTTKSGSSSSGPLCASTPLVKNTSRDSANHRHVDGKETSEYPTLSSFKPQTSTNNSHDSVDKTSRTNSEPLCASTPMVKQGHQDYQTKYSKSGDEERERGGRRNLIDDILGLESCIIQVEGASDNEVIANLQYMDKDNVERTELSVNERKKISREKRKEKLKKKEANKERKKVKGTRIEKFKEYLGPGLTCNPDDENGVENNKPKDFLKNTDVETCTLTEYKGFGLTGPLPDKPKPTSTPAPVKGLTVRDTNIMKSAGDLLNRQPFTKVDMNLPKSVSYKDIPIRPAGLEGFIMTPDGRFPALGKSDNCKSSTLGRLDNCKSSTLGRSDSCKSSTLERLDNCKSSTLRKPLSSSTSQKTLQPNIMTTNQKMLVNRKHVSLPTLTNRPIITGPSVDPPALLLPTKDYPSGSSGQGNSGTSSALQPDEIYPSMASVKSDKSDNQSTDRSDRSNKSDRGPFDAGVLQSFGQLKVSAYMNFGLLTVHVVQGRQLSTKWKSTCDSFVKMCLIPDDGTKPKCKTSVIQDSNNPLYDEKFSFELNDEDHSKRLMISVWHRDQNASVNEFLGCMSFGLRHLTNPKKEVSGWYYLLTEDIGRKKHLKVTQRQVPQLKVRHRSNIPAVNKDVWGTETHHLTLYRGKNGFGFSVVEACPVRVGRVDGTSPAETAGLQPGDIIIRLNKQNVSRSTATSVAKLVKNSSNTLFLEIHRQKPITFEHLENQDQQTNNEYMYEMNENDYSVPNLNATEDDGNKENEMADETIYGIHPNITSLATSTPLPLLARGHRTVQTSEMRKQEAIHRLLSLELDFIDLMHAGMQRYSRPLRHCILSHSQHIALFQNIEKLTTISEYHVKQMHDNAPSSFVSEDTDTSLTSDNHSFMQSIGLIYQSKVHMLCQAYDLYAKGVSKANQILCDLQQNEDFMKFVRDPSIDSSQPSISAFVYQPVKHIRDLYRVLQDLFLNTTQDSSDYNSLKQVVEGLQECATCITNYSCERIESMSSLASRESKTSFTSSMKSRSSTCSSRSSSSKGHSSGRSCSMQTSKSFDSEVMKIQDKLVFSSNVPVFQLCQDDRHVVFSGDMFKWEGHQWVKVHMILFTDMILLTLKEADGYLQVLHEPTMLRDITGMDAQRHHGTELLLYRADSKKKLSLRAPSTEQKYAWKSLVEQRVFAVRGSLEYYSSTSDLSSSSASAIII